MIILQNKGKPGALQALTVESGAYVIYRSFTRNHKIIQLHYCLRKIISASAF